MNFNFKPVYTQQDPMMEIGQTELAIDGLEGYNLNERDALQPDLQSRMDSLLESLDHLGV